MSPDPAYDLECTYAEITPWWQRHLINPAAGTQTRLDPTCLYKSAYINRGVMEALDQEIASEAGQNSQKPEPKVEADSTGKDPAPPPGAAGAAAPAPGGGHNPVVVAPPGAETSPAAAPSQY